MEARRKESVHPTVSTCHASMLLAGMAQLDEHSRRRKGRKGYCSPAAGSSSSGESAAAKALATASRVK